MKFYTAAYIILLIGKTVSGSGHLRASYTKRDLQVKAGENMFIFDDTIKSVACGEVDTATGDFSASAVDAKLEWCQRMLGVAYGFTDDRIYGIQYGGVCDGPHSLKLYLVAIDPGIGEILEVGPPLTAYIYGGIEFDPVNDILYGSDVDGSFYSINKTDGLLTQLETYDIGQGNFFYGLSMPIGSSTLVAALAVVDIDNTDPDCSRCLVTTFLYFFDTRATFELDRIVEVTGIPNDIMVKSIAFASDGALFLSGMRYHPPHDYSLYRIDDANVAVKRAKAALVGPTVPNLGADIFHPNWEQTAELNTILSTIVDTIDKSLLDSGLKESQVKPVEKQLDMVVKEVAAKIPEDDRGSIIGRLEGIIVKIQDFMSDGLLDENGGTFVMSLIEEMISKLTA